MSYVAGSIVIDQAKAYGLAGSGSIVKEIGFLQRAEGLCAGLDDLQNRLALLTAKVNGTPYGEDGTSKAHPSGLDASLSDAEQTLRQCLEAVSRLTNQF